VLWTAVPFDQSEIHKSQNQLVSFHTASKSIERNRAGNPAGLLDSANLDYAIDSADARGAGATLWVGVVAKVVISLQGPEF